MIMLRVFFTAFIAAAVFLILAMSSRMDSRQEQAAQAGLILSGVVMVVSLLTFIWTAQ